LLLLISGCCTNLDHSQKYQINRSIPDADFTFYTIDKKNKDDVQGKELLGFYSLVSDTVTYIDFNNTLIHPLLQNDFLYAIDKKGFPGQIHNTSGYLIIYHDEEYLICKSEQTFGEFFYPYQNSIAIDAIDGGINVVDSQDCSVSQTILTESDISAHFPDKPYLGSFSISTKGDFLLLSSYGRLVKVDLPEKQFYDYHKKGYYPRISPNGKRIAYLSYDGIHLMDLSGENDVLIIEYPTLKFDPENIYRRGIPPIPNWSLDGKKLLYHKCEALGLCSQIEGYSIYIFDISTGIESKIIGNGLNPSWIE
jgi:hypothetical protein